MFSLRPYQPILAAQGCSILRRLGIVYYAVQVRVGKTHISFETARLYGVKWVKLTELVMAALVRDRILTDETAQKIIDGKV